MAGEGLYFRERPGVSRADTSTVGSTSWDLQECRLIVNLVGLTSAEVDSLRSTEHSVPSIVIEALRRGGRNPLHIREVKRPLIYGLSMIRH